MWAPASLDNPSAADPYWLRSIRYVVRKRPFPEGLAVCFPPWFLRGSCAAGNISRVDCERALTAHVSLRIPPQRHLDGVSVS